MTSGMIRMRSSVWLRILVLCGAAWLPVGPAAAESPFHGKDLTAKWEYWTSASPGAGGTFLAATDTAIVTASDLADPDLPGFHTSSGTTFELWDVDFWEQEIRLTYTSIYVQDEDHQYMYLSPVGIHLHDVADVLGDIEDVQVDATFAPFGFDPANVSWDANHIWMDLDGSMCHFGSMGSMPSCTNPASPTGYDNEIVLIVTVPEPAFATTLPFGLVGLWLMHHRRARSARSVRS